MFTYRNILFFVPKINSLITMVIQSVFDSYCESSVTICFACFFILGVPEVHDYPFHSLIWKIMTPNSRTGYTPEIIVEKKPLLCLNEV